jgi:hypothetical protein
MWISLNGERLIVLFKVVISEHHIQRGIEKLTKLKNSAVHKY